jgi:hypothetical protein
MSQYIDHFRFNQIQDKVARILGEGSGDFGYGQINLSSNRVLQQKLITAEDMNSLRADILRIRQHQLGENRGQLISTHPEYLKQVVGTGEIVDRDFIAEQHFSNAETAMTNATNDRFFIGGDPSGILEYTIETYLDSPNGPGTVGGIRSVRTEQWASQLNHIVRINFRNPKEARYFFNAGGEIRITPSISDGNGDAKYQSWQTLLNVYVGTVRMGYNYTKNDGTGGGGQASVGFYQLTSTPTLIYKKSSDPNYQTNSYEIYARVNSSNNNPNAVGYQIDTANVLTLDIRFLDLHSEQITPATDPNTGVNYVKINPDEPVTGRLISEVSQRRPTGSNVLTYGPGNYSNEATIA